jgi:hypothetical protein
MYAESGQNDIWFAPTNYLNGKRFFLKTFV